MFLEYEIVIAKRSLSEKIKAGCEGAILMCFDEDDYEVEFFDKNGDSLEVVTVSGSDLIKGVGDK